MSCFSSKWNISKAAFRGVNISVRGPPWTKPWTAVIPWNKIDPDEQMYEYACHEDNYDIVHFLSGARDRERRGEAK